MKLKRIVQFWKKIRFYMIIDGVDRGNYIRKHHLFKEVGDNLLFQSRNFPMDPGLLKVGNNVSVAANVTFVTHDAIRHMLNYRDKCNYVPHRDCIEVKNDVFIGLGSIILPGVRIGENSIVAAGSLVNKDVPPGTIVGGVPAKIIGYTNDLTKARKEESEKYTQEQCMDDEFVWNRFYSNRE